MVHFPLNDRYQHGITAHTRHDIPLGVAEQSQAPCMQRWELYSESVTVSHTQGQVSVISSNETGGYYSTGTTTVICFIHSPQVDVCLSPTIARKKHNPYKGSEPRTKTIHFLSSVDQVCRSFPVEINLQSPFIKDQPRMFCIRYYLRIYNKIDANTPTQNKHDRTTWRLRHE